MNELIAYLSGLTITQGRLAGHSMKVLPWQKRFIRGAFRSGVQSAALSVARGNGKTALLAGIACATLDGPLMVPRGETVLVASSFEQARIAFEHVLAFMGGKLQDRTVWKVWDTAQQGRIENRLTGARVRCIGSDPRRAHGLSPVLVCCDEPAQWPDTTGERMVAALRTASGKQPFCRFVSLGTRPHDSEHWFSKALNGTSDYAQCHAARPQDPKFQRRTWQKANPSLKFMPDLLHSIQTEAAAAQSDPAVLASFEALRLNLGTHDVMTNVLLESDTWAALEGEDALRTGPYCLGLDLGSTASMSAACAYWPESGRMEGFAVFPANPGLTERGLIDGAGEVYNHAYRRGELLVMGQYESDVSQLLEEVLKRWGLPAAIATDRWREGALRDALDNSGVPPTALILRGMGYKDGSEDVRDFRSACLTGKVSTPVSLLMRYAMSEARVVSDVAGNQKLSKSTQGFRRLKARDDLAAAAIMAIAVGHRKHRVQPAPASVLLGVI